MVWLVAPVAPSFISLAVVAQSTTLQHAEHLMVELVATILSMLTYAPYLGS